MASTPRTSPTHFSRIARRLDNETGMGYQKALSTVQSEADRIMQQGPRLDGAGCDMALRFLLRQDIEYWGPGIGAHMWPQVYHPVSMTLLHSGLCREAMKAAERARDQGQPEPCGGEFDPSYLAAAGVEPLDYGDGPDEDWADEPEEIDPALLEAVDEPDRWKRHVLAQGVRPAFRLPDAHLLPPATREGVDGLEPGEAAERLEQLVLEQPAAAEAFVLRADLVLADAREGAAEAKRGVLEEARRWYECAIAVAEVPLHFPMYGGASDAGPVLLWREGSNRPLLRALYGLALVAHGQRQWNSAEMILMRLLYLDPGDEQRAAVLLRQVRAAAGIVQPDAQAVRNAGRGEGTGA
ncbi:hypothetical protein OG800_50700 (plasmid) [Streptomyces sp. NBC_00445]|uniref:hypothetical protein n=1 Tax=Streptomyces sp. NBC_00445 TaxID=2975745 RepID=UPI002E1A641F